MGSSVGSPAGRDRDLPRRLDARQAARIYVQGRSRALDPEEKRALAGGEPAPAPDAAARRENIIGVSSVSRQAAGVPPEQPRVGVAVPETLHFHRSAGMWRRLGFPRRPPSADPPETGT